MPAIIVCPQCNKGDAIQKISAIVDAGKSSGNYSGSSTSHVNINGKSGTSFGYSYLSGSSMTELAKLLSPPSKPTKPSGYGYWWILIWYPTIPLVGMAFASPFYTLAENLSTIMKPGPIVLVVGILDLILMGIAFFAGIRLAYRFFKNKEKDKLSRKESEYSIEKPKWDNAIKRWIPYQNPPVSITAWLCWF